METIKDNNALLTISTAKKILVRAQQLEKQHMTVLELRSQATQMGLDPRFLDMAANIEFGPTRLERFMAFGVRHWPGVSSAVREFFRETTEEIKRSLVRHGFFLPFLVMLPLLIYHLVAMRNIDPEGYGIAPLIVLFAVVAEFIVVAAYASWLAEHD